MARQELGFQGCSVHSVELRKVLRLQLRVSELVNELVNEHCTVELRREWVVLTSEHGIARICSG